MDDVLSDVNVVLNVLQPAVPVNLGVLAIFVHGTEMSKKSYTALEDVQSGEDSEQIQAIATGYFAQTGHSKQLLVIDYVDMQEALDAYYTDAWEFATVVDSVEDSNDQLTLANYIEAKSERFAIFGLPATAETVNAAATTTQTYFGNDRTILFAYGADDKEAATGIGSLIGALGNQTVGSVTWKFKTLVGLKPCDLSVAQVGTLHKNHIFTYVTKAGIDQTTEGFTVSGEFIDALHGDDWVKASIETDLQKLLTTTAKLGYDVNGIAQIDATITNVLMQATTNGIILDDGSGKGTYNVTTLPREQVSADDIATRHYGGASFAYTRAGAIHSITVHGTVSM
jgi:RNA binding exosome subunit